MFAFLYRAYRYIIRKESTQENNSNSNKRKVEEMTSWEEISQEKNKRRCTR